MFERRRLFQGSVDKKIAKETDQNAISQLIKQRKEYTPASFFSDISNDQLCYDLHPGCMCIFGACRMHICLNCH